MARLFDPPALDPIVEDEDTRRLPAMPAPRPARAPAPRGQRGPSKPKREEEDESLDDMEVVQVIEPQAQAEGASWWDVPKSIAGAVVQSLGATATGARVAAEQGPDDQTKKLLSIIEKSNPEWAADVRARDEAARADQATTMQGAADWLNEGGQSILDSRSEVTKQAEQASTPDGDLTDPSTWTLGQDPSVRGYVNQGARIVGSMAPVIAMALATRGRGAPTQMAATGAAGGLQAGGAGAEEARKWVMDQPHDQLMASSERYAELIGRGVEPGLARMQTAQEAELWAFRGTAVVGAAGGMATGALITQPGEKLAQQFGNRAVRAGVLGAAGGAEEATQEVAEGVATKAGTNIGAGASQSVTEGSFGNAVQGLMGGGAVGAAKGALTGKAKPQADRFDVDDTDNDADIIMSKHGRPFMLRSRAQEEADRVNGVVMAWGDGFVVRMPRGGPQSERPPAKPRKQLAAPGKEVIEGEAREVQADPSTQEGGPQALAPSPDDLSDQRRILRANVRIDEAAHAAATSPTNDLPEPTQAQKEAGNYKVGRITLRLPAPEGGKPTSLPISIENPAGSTRSGTAPDGSTWSNVLKSHYGYVRGTLGADGDHVDVFVKPGIPEDFDGDVFVVDQVEPSTGKFDEHKMLVGPDTEAEARQMYLENYDKGWKGLKALTRLSSAALQAWLDSGGPKRGPIADVQRDSSGTGTNASRPADIQLPGRVDQQPATDRDADGDVLPARDGEPVPDGGQANGVADQSGNGGSSDRSAAETGTDGGADSVKRYLPPEDPNGHSSWWDTLQDGIKWRLIDDARLPNELRGRAWDSIDIPVQRKILGAVHNMGDAYAHPALRDSKWWDDLTPEGKRQLIARSGVKGVTEKVGFAHIPPARRETLYEALQDSQGGDTPAPRAKEDRDTRLKRVEAKLKARRQKRHERAESEKIRKRWAERDEKIAQVAKHWEAKVGPQKEAGGEKQSRTLGFNKEGLRIIQGAEGGVLLIDPKSGAHVGHQTDPADPRFEPFELKIDVSEATKAKRRAKLAPAKDGEHQAMSSSTWWDELDHPTRWAVAGLAGLRDVKSGFADLSRARRIALFEAYYGTPDGQPGKGVTKKHIREARLALERHAFNEALQELMALPRGVSKVKLATEAKRVAAEKLAELTGENDAEIAALEAMAGDTPPKFVNALIREARKHLGAARKEKLENTGVDLRRHWELLRAKLKADQSDAKKAWEEFKKATDRGAMFRPLIDAAETPGMVRYLTDLRDSIVTFQAGLMDGDVYGSSGFGRGAKFQTFQYMIEGDAYPAEVDQDDWSNDDYRIDWLREKAEKYIDTVQAFLEPLQGKTRVAEAAQALTDAFVDLEESEKPENRYTKPVLNERGKRELSGKVRRWPILPTGPDLWRYTTESSVVQELIEKETNTDLLPDRAKPLTPPRLEKITRLRKGTRQGDVTPKQMKAKFGLADVGFGKWVGTAEDQAHLNYAYDAFEDLAWALGIEPHNIGFGGNLHLTVGALGHGKFAAHFQPAHPVPGGGSVPVINVTKTRGDGTLWHEWTHALDWFLTNNNWAGLSEGNRWDARSALLQALKHQPLTIERVENRALDFLERGWRFKGRGTAGNTKVQTAVYAMTRGDVFRKETQFYKDAKELGEGYWANNNELIARASEAFAADLLAEKGATNDYLVNPSWSGDGMVTKQSGHRGTPYPMGDERKVLNGVMKSFFDAVSFDAAGKPTFSQRKFEEGLSEETKAAEARRLELTDEAAMQRFWDDYRSRKAEEAQAKTEAEQAELDRLAQEALEGLEVDDGGQAGPLDDAELEALFDEAAAELAEETQEKPDAPPPGGTLESAATSRPGRPGPAVGNKPASRAATKMAAEAAKLGVEGVTEAFEGLVKLFGGGPGRLSSFPGGLDEETYAKAKPHFEAALARFQAAGRTLKDLFKLLIAELGHGVKPYAIRFAKEQGLGHDLGSAQPTPTAQIAAWVREKLRDPDEPSISSKELFAKADEAYGGTQAEGRYSVKDAYDAMEAGMNMAILRPYDRVQARNPFDPNVSADEAMRTVARLQAMTTRLATQTKRTAEMDEFQQFSTPPAFAFAAAWVANPSANDVVMEPSAGTGGLAVFARVAGARLVLNELSPRRGAVLGEVFPDVKIWRENAEQINNILPADIVPTLVIMNPPFSATAGRIEGKRDTKIGAQHIEQALKRLAPGGRLVAIVGEGMAMDRPAFKDWWAKIGKEFDVRAAIPASGDGYVKYGTTFDNVLLVIDKIQPSGRPPITQAVEDYNSLIGLLNEVRHDRPATAAPGAGDGAAQHDRPNADSLPGPDEGEGEGSVDSGDDADPDSVRGNGDGDRGPASTDADASDEQAAGKGNRRSPGRSRSGRGGGGGRPGGRDTGRGGRGDADVPGGSATGEAVSLGQAKDRDGPRELTESIFEPYWPEKVSIEGAKEHPGALVESAAMASVSPVDPTYTPTLPRDTIAKGKLSIAQLEAIVYAGQAHEQTLEEGARRGFFIGDGTGVGKGREISGIILDNWLKGRKRHVWVSEKAGLLKDAQRDFGGIGGDASLIRLQNDVAKATGKIELDEGILFTTYATLRSSAKPDATSKDDQIRAGKRRLDQLVEWLGEDFDGVIAFDEAHNAGNALPVKGARGMTKPSAQALAVVELQEKLPKARVVYVSATGATKVENLSYATRLGMWGRGTPFSGLPDFVTQISAGGLAAMELVARDLKQNGAYLARSLSYEGIVYSRTEHSLSDLERDIYDRLSDAWQVVLQNIAAAIEVTDGGARAKGNAMSAFWGANQRFFNQVITSMQMGTVVDAIERDIAAGKAVVLQIVNTNEAAQERALQRAATDDDADGELEDLDLTPRDILIEMVRKSFPVVQWTEVPDANGNPVKVPLKDSKGELVLNAEAVAMRDALISDLEKIRVPDGPLERLFNQIGPERVAEVTGRKRRVVPMVQEDGEVKLVVEKRGKAAASADAQAFIDGKKDILIFSDAGGTGYSFHADRGYKNQKPRIHYLVQPGWRADKAVQGLGRTHRSNQSSTPEFRLVSTDVPAQARFLSSIARRLDQLGALTKGQRDTANQGLFTERDNLEGPYAQGVVRLMVSSAARGVNVGLTKDILENQMGIFVLDEKGDLQESKIPDVPQFLNRLLSVKLDTQAEVFEAFFEALDLSIQTAIENDSFDAGMQTIKALRTSIIQDEVVRTDERTGATTRLVELEAETANIFHEFPVAMPKGVPYEYMVNEKSGKIWARRVSGNATGSDGVVRTRYRMAGTNGTVFRTENEFGSGWKPVTIEEARELWDAENAARPPTVTRKEVMIVGTILPVWDLLPAGKKEVVRTQTDDGVRLLGMRIPAKDVPEIRRKFNVLSAEAKMPPAKLLAAVLKGKEIELVNGWRIKRARVANDLRVEVVDRYGRPLTGGNRSSLVADGVFMERIDWNERLFIPTGADGVPILEKVIGRHPVMEVHDPQAKKADDKPSFRRGRGARVDPAQVRAWADEIIGQWENRPEVIVLDTFEDAPAEVRAYDAEFDAEKPPSGFVFRGKVYIIADQMRDRSNVEIVLLHEIAGHHGLRGLFGNALDSILKMVIVGRAKEIAQKCREYGLDPKNPEHRLEAAEEILASMAERNPSLNLVQRAFARIRAWLRSHGIGKSLSDVEIVRDILIPAREWVQRGQRGPSGPGGGASVAPESGDPMFRRQATPRDRRGGLLDRVGQTLGGEFLARRILSPAARWTVQKVDSFIPSTVKAQVVDDYGLDEGYRARREERQAEMNAHFRKTKNLIDGLTALTRDQSRVAYQWLTEKGDLALAQRVINELPDDERDVLARIRLMINELGKEAVELGLMSRDSFERNEFTYLHRTYQKHQSERSKFAHSTKHGASIRAQNFKGRGLRHDIADDALIQYVDKVTKGDMLEQLITRDSRGRKRKIIYVRPGERPKGTEGMESNGIWEARWMTGKKGQRRMVGMWRDYTLEERQRMGEIDEARFAVAKTVLGAVNDIENARFLRWVRETYATDPESARESGRTVHEARYGYLLNRAYKPEDWVIVPSSTIPGTRLKRFGALAGQAVPAPIWNDIRSEFGSTPEGAWKVYDWALRAWKISKTALSPAVHMNNVMANFVFADMADVKSRDISRALKIMIAASRGDADAQRILDAFDDSGAELGSLVAAELHLDTVEGLLSDLENEANDEARRVGIIQAVSMLLHGQWMDAWHGLRGTAGAKVPRKVFDAMTSAYRNEDRVFRLAAFLSYKREGEGDLDAGRHARDAFLNYRINAPLIQAARRSVFPFIAFSYRALPLLAKTAVEKPWKLAKYAAIMKALNAATYALLGLGGDDEDEERANLPEEMQGRMFGIAQRAVRMPWSSADDQPVFLDIRRWVPGGDVFDMNHSQSAIPTPDWLQLGGPLALFVELVMNKSGFTGKPIVEATDTAAEAAIAVTDHLFKFASPNVPVPNPAGWAADPFARMPGVWQTYSWTNISRAASGQTDYFGRDRELVPAITGAMGVKLRSYSPGVARANEAFDYRASEREIKEQMRRIARARGQGAISEDQAQSRLDRQREKLRRLNEKLLEQRGK